MLKRLVGAFTGVLEAIVFIVLVVVEFWLGYALYRTIQAWVTK